MKKLLIVTLFFCYFNAFSQSSKKNDSIFYLLDTAKTPTADGMWSVSTDKGSDFKYYAIQCPCLKLNGVPTFFYSISKKGEEGKLIDKSELKTIKLISLPSLILKSKQLLDTEMISRSFFFIEPEGKKYIMRNVALINPAIKITSPPDVVASKPDTSAFATKGLIAADAKDLDKYINKTVVTSGKAVNFRIVEKDKLETLLVGADYPNQDFTIIIKGKNLSNFYTMTAYKGRLLRVTGTVTEYMGRPAVELTDEKQIQVLPIKK